MWRYGDGGGDEMAMWEGTYNVTVWVRMRTTTGVGSVGRCVYGCVCHAV